MDLSSVNPFMLAGQQPFKLYKKPVDPHAQSEADGEEGEEDNISEMMQTFRKEVQWSARHPVAHFNESHPT